jgi:transposase InsO family protein
MRKLVGFHIDELMTKKRVIQALDQALRLQRPRDEVFTLFQSWRPICFHGYQMRLRKYGMTGSMSRKGNC